ncbi:MAG: glycosyltransferase [Lachnospiraceae bacterium]|nr:glycosyltransferase [Lachnospiraceae bacterium]
MFNEKISIIVPVYNGEKYLEQCLDSLVEQTYTNIEIICINGSSNDNSLKILNQYAKIDSRIKVITRENKGVSISRNEGLNVATGEFILFVDADDWIEKNTCEIVLQEFLRNKTDIVMWSYIREFQNNSQPKKIFDYDRIEYSENDVKQLHRRFIGLIGKELEKVENADALCPVWGKLYKREIIEEYRIRFIDIRDIGTYEDGLFNLEYFAHVKKAVYIQQYLYHYRKDNPASITSKYKE